MSEIRHRHSADIIHMFALSVHGHIHLRNKLHLSTDVTAINAQHLNYLWTTKASGIMQRRRPKTAINVGTTFTEKLHLIQ